MIGKTYLERGKPVTVLVRWGKGGGPRNVLIERADGERVVRPFRGLRVPKPSKCEQSAHSQDHGTGQGRERVVEAGTVCPAGQGVLNPGYPQVIG